MKFTHKRNVYLPISFRIDCFEITSRCWEIKDANVKNVVFKC